MPVELFNWNVVPVVVALAILTERLVDWFVRPIFVRKSWDTFYLQYVGLVVGGSLSLICNQNMFLATLMPNVPGLLVTATICGGGSNLINQVTSRRQPAELTLTATPQSLKMTATGAGGDVVERETVVNS